MQSRGMQARPAAEVPSGFQPGELQRGGVPLPGMGATASALERIWAQTYLKQNPARRAPEGDPDGTPALSPGVNPEAALRGSEGLTEAL